MSDKDSVISVADKTQTAPVPPKRLKGTFKKRLGAFKAALEDPVLSYAELEAIKAEMASYCAAQDATKPAGQEALRWYGFALVQGMHGYLKDVVKGIELLTRSAEGGHEFSAETLGDLYYGIWADKAYKDFHKALVYYNRANSSYALYRIASIHYYGMGVEKNTAYGLENFMKAAGMGSEYAMNELGYLAYQDKRYEEAFDLFCRAYKCRKPGNIYRSAQYNLGLCYYNGHGVAKDAERGRKLIESAAGTGNYQAKKWIEENTPKDPPKQQTPPDTVEKPDEKPKKNRNSKKTFAPQKLDKPLDFIDFNQKATPSVVKQPVAAKILTREDLNEMMQVFDNYVGLDVVKNQIRGLFYMALAAQRRKQAGIEQSVKPMLHMVFKGNPGTGKTVVARLMADILHKMGFLSKGHLVEVDRSKLVGAYIGWSERATQEAINKASGGVLFIDEAYDLDKPSSWNDFGHEVITKLVKSMEDKRDNLVVIFAGYPAEMAHFVSANPGLRSRIAMTIDFPDYKDAELVQIFQTLCVQKKYVLDNLAREKVLQVLNAMKPNAKDKFGNGRGVRNLFEQTLRRQAQRVVEHDITDEAGLSLILAADIPGEATPPREDGRVTYLSSKA